MTDAVLFTEPHGRIVGISELCRSWSSSRKHDGDHYREVLAAGRSSFLPARPAIVDRMQRTGAFQKASASFQCLGRQFDWALAHGPEQPRLNPCGFGLAKGIRAEAFWKVVRTLR